jgi:glycosyltransferase involved in cell wall biosynthesis
METDQRGSRESSVSIFLPAYNEVDNLEAAVADVEWAAQQVLGDYEILIIDDGSTDGTGLLADRLAEKSARIRVIHQPRNQGIAAAYVRALDEARLDYFSFLAADGEIARESIRAILGSVGRADIVAPYHQNPAARQLHRRFLTWGSTALVNVLFWQRMHYYQGPCIYPLALARALPKTAGGFYFLTQMLLHALHAGYTCVEVGLTHVDRTAGHSKAVSAKNILKALQTIAQAWWTIRLTGSSVARRPNDGVEPTGGARDRWWWIRRSGSGTEAADSGLPGAGDRPLSLRHGGAVEAPGSRAGKG